MQDLRPPTDNLYKFIAIFGIVVAALGCWNLGQISKKIDDSMVDSASARIFLRHLNDKQESEAEKMKNMVNLSKEYLDYLKIEHEYFNEIERKQITDSLRNISYAEAASLGYEKTKCLSALYIITGILISLIGFIAWYFTTQRYMDHILKLERNNKINSTTSPT